MISVSAEGIINLQHVKQNNNKNGTDFSSHDVIERSVVPGVGDASGQEADALLDVGDGGQPACLLEPGKRHLHVVPQICPFPQRRDGHLERFVDGFDTHSLHAGVVPRPLGLLR